MVARCLTGWLALVALLGCDAPEVRATSATTATTNAPTPSATTNDVPASARSSASTAAPSASAPAAPPPALLQRTHIKHLDLDFSDGPLFFTASFDGSQSFRMWLDTMRVARELENAHGQPIHLTYFVNTCFYSTVVNGSQIGRAQSPAEIIARRALTQQALNEGHEIGNHGVRHDAAMEWDDARWERELMEFHAVADTLLFEPVPDGSGGHVFPRFEPPANTPPHSTGARCEQDDDCNKRHCLAITERDRFCTEPCNRHKPCAAGTLCGTPTFHDDTDVCVPKPHYPIEHEGKVLFDARGRPNVDHPKLVPYRIRGHRAPFLVFSDAMVEALLARGYVYDASQVSRPGTPLRIGTRDRRKGMLGFALMQYPTTRTVPMDYNYLKIGAGRDAMIHDYQHSLLAAYADVERPPWNVGHHFSRWRDGAYWEALQETLRFAARGCPDANGKARCSDIRFPSFRELARIVVDRVKSNRDR